jgi:hypothetical protein
MNLYNDESNLIWGTDVVITDSTLQREVENLQLQEINTQQLIISPSNKQNSKDISNKNCT